MDRIELLESVGMTIRQYRNSDRDQVIALHVLALQPTGTEARGGAWDEDLENIEAVYLHNGGEFLVGERNGEILAMGALRKVSSSLAEIKRMRVHPHWQRQGLGQLFLDRLQMRAIELGYTKLCLDTSLQLTAAQALYRKNGFVELGRTVLSGLDAILFEKQL